jgi:hypothetical protein
MSRRTLTVAVGLAAVVAVALVAAYMTGVVTIGDPFVGSWKADSGDPRGTTVIRQTDEGYSFTFVWKNHSNGWHPVTRTRNTLSYEVKLPGGKTTRVSIVFQPWNRRLNAGGRTQHKVSDETTAPPTAPATPDQEF